MTFPRLLFLGDSITVGWALRGNDKDNATQCNIDEDHSEAWGPRLSQLLQAEFHSIAWSGIGLLRGDPYPSGGTPLNRSIPMLMTQTLANEPDSVWDSSLWPVSAVVIHIGTNDFCPKFAHLDRKVFVEAYLKLLLQVKKEQRPHGGTLDVFSACGPMGTPGDPEYGHPYFSCDVLQEVVEQAGDGLRVHVLDFSGLYIDRKNIGGCDHPGVLGHAAMAEIARPVVEAAIGW